MNLISRILESRSVSIVGLAKHTGKTETVNFVLRNSQDSGKRIGITSIGVDGESSDISSTVAKPEIELYAGMIFATSEAHYRQKKLVSEIVGTGIRRTSLGKIVIARALSEGNVILSGPADTGSMQELLPLMKAAGAETILVEGALSRLSPASPAVTESLILCTGAAVSGNPEKLVAETAFVCELAETESIEETLSRKLRDIGTGIWAIGEDRSQTNIGTTAFSKDYKNDLLRSGNMIYVAGAINDDFLNTLIKVSQNSSLTLIAKDFTRIVASKSALDRFRDNGGKLRVAMKSDLIALCVNPFSPTGGNLDYRELLHMMRQAVNVPVYDVRHPEE